MNRKLEGDKHIRKMCIYEKLSTRISTFFGFMCSKNERGGLFFAKNGFTDHI